MCQAFETHKFVSAFMDLYYFPTVAANHTHSREITLERTIKIITHRPPRKINKGLKQSGDNS